MIRRVPFSGENLGLPAIAEHHKDLEASLRLYFSDVSPQFPVRFVGCTNDDVIKELGQRLAEIGLTSSLTILSCVEAAFRIDYLQRCQRRDKQPISRAFRAMYKSRRERVSLEDDIFKAWIAHQASERQLIAELKGAFKFRHWLAHGRYFEAKLGRRFDYEDVYALAEETFDSIPFLSA